MDVPADWKDITWGLPSEAPPTLAKGDGLGALQFSVALDGSVLDPSITEADLRGFLREFVRSHFGGAIVVPEVDIFAEKVIVRGIVDELEGVVAIWYVSDGSS